MEILIGLAVLVATYYAFRALEPKAGAVHRLMQREVIAASLTLCLVAGLTFGVAFVVYGVTRFT